MSYDEENKDKKEFKRFQIRWAEKIQPDAGCYYLQRWVFTAFDYSIRIHRWLHDDDQRNMHDHPHWMYIFILKGGYTDISPNGRDHLQAGSFRFRPAEHRHMVHLDEGGCWSLLFTGPTVRDWGFWVPGRNRLLRPARYFSRFKHHQCD